MTPQRTNGRRRCCSPKRSDPRRERHRPDGASADEPASIFFAFADRRRAFPFAWKLMAVLLARRQAALNGLSLDSTASELDALCIDVLYQHASWETIRAWFTLRLRATDE